MAVTLDDAPGRAHVASIARDASNRWLWLGVVAVVAAGVLEFSAPAPLPRDLLAGSMLSLVAVPCLLRHFVPSKAVVLVALLVTLVPLGLGVARVVGITNPGEGDIHDTTVINDEASRMMLRGENPYRGDFGPALPPVWRDLGYGADGQLIRNPAIDTYPYLPGSFLLNAPFVAVGDALGVGWDARILYLLAVVAMGVVVARRPEPAHARAAMIVGAIGLPLTYYLCWGTNDAASLSLFLIGALIGKKRPALAGVALGLALSFKIVMAIPLLALAAFVLRTEGWSGVWRRWTCPALLAVTVLPYLAADPSVFVDEALLFNLNRGSFRFPVLGIGLPALAPGVFHGPLLVALVVVGAVGALVVPAVVVWRRPTLPVALVAGGLAMLGMFIPASNFRPPYLVLVATLVAGGWLGSTRIGVDPVDETS